MTMMFTIMINQLQVEPSAFASGATVNGLLKEMEELFAVRFERGDKKKALVRLRAGSQHKSHHFSTFRSGAWLGLALPPRPAIHPDCPPGVEHPSLHLLHPVDPALVFVDGGYECVGVGEGEG
ncbi:hypothetical protein SERLADRAFT_433683 [Serpula lacrymans var. lacrymans S7.9]|uniref:Uncharacterized protein n=1 Tax=Serpula lacrymans var. lacrymans (strain S7.9) TaxID=578457 RepID=F8NHZ4_SERL9|nr:uncharacterized protein SERLADRAFT_433683 [Serpula lacrymans var. lacrymans S7.9]EGO29716.1 hypothetical protein SERLADRAFT_433683 [Serpula lacrymans var. lacrymans S7.9]